jgi:DNA-binding winged helix-turn-helix (wHTH) protein/tetratricopeptide (TPR) repeat protein
MIARAIISMNPAASRYRFHAFELDAREFRLSRGSAPVTVSPKAIDLLLLLVGHPATLVSKDDISRALWPDVAVTDNALTQLVSELRHALDDPSATPHYIETVPRRGYRFIAPVESLPIDGQPVIHQQGKAHTASPLPSPFRAGVRETPSLAAHRAFTAGREKLERIDIAGASAAIEDFQRALELDPRYALAYVGLAHARFWLFEASRLKNRRDIAVLTEALADVHHAIDLDPDLPEAYAALALMLVSANRHAEAVAAGRRAVALEPGNWRNHCRLGLAAWGTERLQAFDRVRDLYPEFAYAYYGQAMVHVARGDLTAADALLRTGIPFQDQGTSPDHRLPARGLHWLLGLIRLEAGDLTEARAQLTAELSTGGTGVYATEFVVNALDGLGFVELEEGDPTKARDCFTRALDLARDHPRSLLGLAIAEQLNGSAEGTRTAFDLVAKTIADLQSSRRGADAALTTAALQIAQGSVHEGIDTLHRWLHASPPSFAGWLVPLDPLFRTARGQSAFADVLSGLRDRAR